MRTFVAKGAQGKRLALLTSSRDVSELIRGEALELSDSDPELFRDPGHHGDGFAVDILGLAQRVERDVERLSADAGHGRKSVHFPVHGLEVGLPFSDGEEEGLPPQLQVLHLGLHRVGRGAKTFGFLQQVSARHSGLKQIFLKMCLLSLLAPSCTAKHFLLEKQECCTSLRDMCKITLLLIEEKAYHLAGIEPTTSRVLLRRHVLYHCATTAAFNLIEC